MLTVLLISTSFLAYLSLAILYFMYILRHKYMLIMSSLFAVIILYSFKPLIHLKLISYSTLERKNSIEQAFNYFLDSPFLGFGFSNITSHDLIINMSVNIGLIGLTVLIILIFMIFNENRTRYSGALKKTALLLLIIQTCSGFTYPYFMVWFILGMTVSSSRLLETYTYALNLGRCSFTPDTYHRN